MKPILEVTGLAKTYDTGTVALKNVSFDVRRGEFLVVIGLSGSGKSTLLRCLNYLTCPDAGQIRFDGVVVAPRDARGLRARRRRIAMIFQHFNLVPRLSVLANVLTGRLGERTFLQSLFGLHPAAAQAEARATLKTVGLEALAARRVDRLSGGQKQRVAIARALHQRPDLILADEPVASLDPATSRSVMTYLRDANRRDGVTVICNLHFLSLVREFADRVIALKDGEVVFTGTPDQIDADWFKRIYGEEARDVSID